MFAWNVDPERCEPAPEGPSAAVGALATASTGRDAVCAEGEAEPPAPANEYEAARELFQLSFDNDWGCEQCGHRRCTQLRTRPRLFGCNRCGHRLSVTAGTALHRCRVPLVLVAKAARLLSRPDTSISARRLAQVLDVSVETAWSLGHRLRSGFVEAAPTRLEPAEDLVLSRTSVLRRPARGEPPARSPLGRCARFVMFWDPTGRAAVQVGALDPLGTRSFVDRHAEVDRPPTTFLPARRHPARISNATHRGVSERWLPFYLASIVGWTNADREGRDPAVVTLAGALRSTRRPFRRLRPGAPIGQPLADEVVATLKRMAERDLPPRCQTVPSGCPCGLTSLG